MSCRLDIDAATIFRGLGKPGAVQGLTPDALLTSSVLTHNVLFSFFFLFLATSEANAPTPPCLLVALLRLGSQ